MKIVLLRLFMVVSKYTLRLFILQLICMNFVLARTSHSQNLDEIKVSLSVDAASITQVLQAIEQKTDFVFAYTESVQNIETSFTLHFDDASLRRILEEVSMQGRLQFKRINNTISVVHFPKEKRAPAVVTLFTVSGTVSDESGLRLPGVNVVLKGTTTGTATDAEGRYTLALPDEDSNGTLIFSFIGYVSVEEPISGRTTIDISLQQDVTSLEEVVVIGYQTVEKKDLTGAVSVINPEATRNVTATSLAESIQRPCSGSDG